MVRNRHCNGKAVFCCAKEVAMITPLIVTISLRSNELELFENVIITAI